MSDSTSTTPPSQSFFSWLTGELDAGWAFLQNLFQSLVNSEVSALAPFAEQAVATLITDISSVFNGGLPAYAAAVAPVLTATAEAAANAGVQAGGASLVAAVSGAMANAQSAAQTPPTSATTAAPAGGATPSTSG